MSKAFTKESDKEESEAEEADALPASGKNYVTPAGLAALQDEFGKLLTRLICLRMEDDLPFAGRCPWAGGR